MRSTPSTEPVTPRARAVLGLVAIGSGLVVIDLTIVTIGLPAIHADLGGPLAGVQWVVVAYVITMGAVNQAVGSLSDRWGRRRVHLGGLALFTLASLACGLAGDIVQLDAARAVQGIGGAILMVNALPLISHAYEGSARAMAIAKWGSLASAAGLVAPLLGGVLVDTLGWRSMFLINIPFGIGALVLAWRVLPSDVCSPDPKPLDRAGTLLLIGSLGLLTYGLLRGGEQGWTSAATLVQLGVAGTGIVCFLVLQRRVAAPTLDLDLFRVPAFTGAAVAIFLSRVLTIGGTVYLVQFLDGSLHLAPTQTGLLLAPVFLAQIGMGLVGGKLQARMAPGHLIAAGYGIKAAGAVWAAVVISPAVHPLALLPALLLWGLGGGLAGSPVFTVAMNVTAKSRAGMVAGTVTSLASLGAGIGTAALGALFTARLVGTAGPAEQGYATAATTVLLVSAGLAGVAALTALTLVSSRRVPKPA
ncbi:MFS transporter [Pseudonocardia sp. TRM90224]|uniref:MFS transporter n=1 Tax=Pseudonocardia sp. TRM90224 TaxID=2812678 RepID=UPI001E2A250B|nr:MFS transporter [Pseudonocardia sp. TRM90224]